MDPPDSLPYQQQYDEGNLEGDMTVPESPERNAFNKQYHTLDEPVKDTILRDLKAVGIKFYHVLYPKKKKALLKDWDLWGPLILCVFLAGVLQGSENLNNANDGGLQFAEVFLIVWLGAVIVTMNCKLLGGHISCFQSVCVLGYCLLAPSLALLMCMLIPLMFGSSLAVFIIKFIVTMLGCAWATIASTVFLEDYQPPRRKALVVFPIFLFYFVISWLIISRSY